MLKSTLALFLNVVLSLPVNGAEETYALKREPLSVKVNALNSEMVRFESCENGRCRILGEGTGYYRLRDLEETAGRLTTQFERRAKIGSRFTKTYNAAATLAGLSWLFLNPVTQYLGYDLENTFDRVDLEALLHRGSGFVFVTWAVYRLLVRKYLLRNFSAQASALPDALERRFKTYDEDEFRDQLDDLDCALKSELVAVQQCEIDLITHARGNAAQTSVPGPGSGADTSTSAP